MLYPNGNERLLFTLAEKKGIPLIVLNYVEEELKAILHREGLDPDIIIDFLDTYPNVAFQEIGEITDEEAVLAKENVLDLKDRPLFVYAYRCICDKRNCYLVTGDKDLHRDEVKNRLNGRVYRAKEIIESKIL